MSDITYLQRQRVECTGRAESEATTPRIYHLYLAITEAASSLLHFTFFDAD